MQDWNYLCVNLVFQKRRRPCKNNLPNDADGDIITLYLQIQVQPVDRVCRLEVYVLANKQLPGQHTIHTYHSSSNTMHSTEAFSIKQDSGICML